ERHGDGDDGDIDPAVDDPENDGRQGKFEDGRQGVEDREPDDRLDALHTTLDDPRQAAGAPLQMEAQRQIVHVNEGAVTQLPDRMLPDAGKQSVAKLVEAKLQDSDRVVS